MKINAEELVRVLDFPEEFREKKGWRMDIEFIEKTITDHGRWTVTSDYIFKIGDKYYKIWRSEGATESQCGEDSWGDYGWDDLELVEVKKEQVVIEQWKEVE